MQIRICLMSEPIDCYGYLYDEFLSPCRDKCELRHRCKQKVQDKLKKFGKENFYNKKKEVLLASQALAQSEKSKRKIYFRPLKMEISEIVSEVIQLLKDFGLKAHSKKYYLVFKDKSRKSMIHLSKLKSNNLNKLVRFVRITDQKQFPETIQNYVSVEKCCGQHYFTGNSIEDLKKVLTIYLDQVNAVLQNHECENSPAKAGGVK